MIRRAWRWCRENRDLTQVIVAIYGCMAGFWLWLWWFIHNRP